MDIHKGIALACCAAGQGKKGLRPFGTTAAGLPGLCGRLRENGAEAVAMEPAASYWKPISSLPGIEGMPAVPANARHAKSVPGRKADAKGSGWLADLLRHGPLEVSSVQKRDARGPKGPVRCRDKPIGGRARGHNRMDKASQGASIELPGAASRMGAASATGMCRSAARGETAPEAPAPTAKGAMRSKAAELERALQGLIQPHQQVMPGPMPAHTSWPGPQTGGLDTETGCRMQGTEAPAAAIAEVPGIGPGSA